MKSAVDLLSVLPLNGFTAQAIDDVLAGFAVAAEFPLDRLAAGFFATNPNATSATFSSGNLTVSLARFDPAEPLSLAAAEIPPIPGAPAGAVAFCAVRPFSAAAVAASNLTGASTSVGISGPDGAKIQVSNLEIPIKISIPGAAANTSECVYYNVTQRAWATDGCSTTIVDGTATCVCNHLTEFGMRFKAIADTNAGIFSSLSKLVTLEGILAALPIILLLGCLGAAMFAAVAVLHRLDLAAFSKYAAALDSSAEFELIRRRTPVGEHSWDQLTRAERTRTLNPGLTVPVPPTIPTRALHLIRLWAERLPFQHPWLGIFFRFNPQAPRIYRAVLIVASILTSVAISVLFYGYKNGAAGSAPTAPITLIETIVLSLITTAVSMPVSRFLYYLSDRAGALEFHARYSFLNVELTKIQNFLEIMQRLPRPLLLSELERLEGKIFGHNDFIYLDPGMDADEKAAAAATTASIDAAAVLAGALDTTEASLATGFLYGLCCRPPLQKFRARLRRFIGRYAHVHTFRLAGGNLCGPAWLPIHTPLSALNTLFLLVWMAGCATYILGFTSYQNSDVALSVFKSVAISLATSNLIVVPMLLFVDLLIPYLRLRHEGPEEAVFYPLELYLYKANIEFVAQASLGCCIRDAARRSIIVAPPALIMRKVDLDLGEESLRLESRIQNLFWALD
jgi:hypothetical protein